MNKLLILGAVSVMAAASTPCLAESSSAFSPTTFYGKVGVTAYRADYGSGPATNAALGGGLGVRFGKYLGGEADVNFGVSDQTVGTVKSRLTTAFGVYGVGFWPVTEQVDLFARVGYGHQTVRQVFTPGGTFTDGNDTVNIGVGMQYFFTKNDAVRIDATRYQHARVGDGDVNNYSISYVRKF